MKSSFLKRVWSKFPRISLVTLLFVLSIDYHLEAQTFKIDTAELNTEQKLIFSKIIAPPWVKSFQLIRSDILLADNPKSISIDLPGEIQKITAHQKNLEVNIGKYHFKGSFSINGKPNDANTIELMDDGDGIYGYITVDGGYYSIDLMDKGKSLVTQHDISKYPADNCQDQAKVPIGKKELLEIRTGPNTANCRVKALIIHTQGATNVVNPTTTGNTGIAQTNTGFANGGIAGRCFSAGSYLVNIADPGNFQFGQTDDYINTTVLTNAQINTLRTQYNPDIIVLLANWANPVNLGGGVTANLFGFIATTGFNNPAVPVAVIRAPDAIGGRFTLAHEIAHLFNARHDNDNVAPPGRGFIFNQGGQVRRTIMAALPVGQVRIQFFSDPGSTFNGVAAGTNTNDNSNNINNTLCGIANWTNSYDLSISAPSTATTGQSISVNTNIFVNTYPVTLDWYAGTNSSFQPFVLTQQATAANPNPSYNFTFPNIPSGSFYYVKCIMTPPGGLPTIAKLVSIQKIGIEPIVQNRSNLGQLNIFPNPIKKGAVLSFKVDGDVIKNEYLEILLLNSLGQTVLTMKSLSQNVLKIPTSNLNEGIYYLKTPFDTKKIQIID